jgi:TonB family protein
MLSHYEILGVDRDATAAEIKVAYRFAAKAFHPDKFTPGSNDAATAQSRFQQIVEAYRVLSDERSRAEYDRFQKYTSETAVTPPAPKRRFVDRLRARSSQIGEKLIALSTRRISVPTWGVILAIALLATTILVVATRSKRPVITPAKLATQWKAASATPSPTARSILAQSTPSHTPSTITSPAPSLNRTDSTEPETTPSDGEETALNEELSPSPESEVEDSEENDQTTGPNANGEWQGRSPDRKLLAKSLVTANTKGTRVAIFTVEGKSEKQIAQHFFMERLIAHIAWSPDSHFLLFTTTNVGGHSAWHYAAFVFSAIDKSFHKLDDDIGDVVEPKVEFDAPNKALLTVRVDRFDDKGPPEREVVVPLDKINFSALPRTSNTATDAEANFIRNGDFSLGTTFWNVSQQASAVRDPKNHDNDALWVPIIERLGVFSQDLLIPPASKKLLLSFRLYQSGGTPDKPLVVSVLFFDSGGLSRQADRRVIRSQQTWQTITVPLLALEQEKRDAVSVEIACPDGTSVLVDDFILSELSDNRNQRAPLRIAQYAINKPPPAYPLTARQRRATGSGVFLLRVDVESGRVKDVTVEKTTGDKELDNAAVTAFRKWRFKPGALRSLKETHGRGPRQATQGEEAVLRVPATFAM